MNKIEQFREDIKIAIKVKEGMMNRVSEIIESCVKNDPVAFADQILSNAEELCRLKNEIINLKANLYMLDALAEDE